MEDPGVERLRAHLRQHNRNVLLLSLGTLAIAIVLWGALYFVVWWICLLFGTVRRPMDYHLDKWALMPGFTATGLVLCFFAWLSRRMRPNEVVRDQKGFGDHSTDLLLAVPRFTLGVFGLGAATVRLNQTELEQAWQLLHRMERELHPVPIQSLPVDIPDPVTRKKILLALQLAGLIELHPTSAGPVLRFRDNDARLLAQDRVRLRP